jgi:hypothetical protein
MADEKHLAPAIERRLVKDEPGKKVGQLRLWWGWGDENGRFNAHFFVETVEEAKDIIKRLAAEQVNDDTIDFNVHGLEEWQDFGEGLQWYDWTSPEGDSIDEVMENEIDPDGPLELPELVYAKKPSWDFYWTYHLDITDMMGLAEKKDPREFDLAIASRLAVFIHDHPELENDVELNWLMTKFFVLGASKKMNEYELLDRSNAVLDRLFDWADEGKRCWIGS